MLIIKNTAKPHTVTVETQYNKVLGTGNICLLNQLFCFISSQKQ